MKRDRSNYTGSFGLQWRTFARAQLDSANGTTISRDRFTSITGWSHDQIEGKIVADFGCGMGRFAEIALAMGPEKLIVVDYSDAVWVALENLRHDARVDARQESILDLASIPDESVDYGYCIGVLQHTPDPAKALQVIFKKIKPGGQLAIWAYEKNWKAYVFRMKYLMRGITRRLPPSLVLRMMPSWVAFWLPIASALRRVGLSGASKLLPVASYCGQLPLSPTQMREWAILDTFDNWTPRYDLPLTRTEVTAGLAALETQMTLEWNDHVPGVTAVITRL